MPTALGYPRRSTYTSTPQHPSNITLVVVAGKVFGPLHFTRHDLAVLTIMRGRDHGVLDYNSARVAYGLPAITTWADINPWLNAANPDVSFEF